MNVPNLVEFYSDQSNALEKDIKENPDIYLYRFLPVCTILFIGSLVLHLSTKSSLLAAKTLQNDLLHLAIGVVVCFFGGNVFFVAGNLLLNRFSPKQDN